MKWCDYQIINPTDAKHPAYVHYFLKSDHFSDSGIFHVSTLIMDKNTAQ